MCLLARRRRDTVVVVVMVVVWGVGMVMVMMVRQLGMGHGMVMMMVVVVMMMRSRVVCGWCDLLAGCLRFVFPRSQRLMNGRSISRRMRGMMVVMMMVMVMVMVRVRRRCLLVVMLRLGYTTWLTWHLIGRSGNRHSVRIIMMWYTVYFVWHGRMSFWLTRRLIRDHRAQAHGVLRA